MLNAVVVFIVATSNHFFTALATVSLGAQLDNLDSTDAVSPKNSVSEPMKSLEANVADSEAYTQRGEKEVRNSETLGDGDSGDEGPGGV